MLASVDRRRQDWPAARALGVFIGWVGVAGCGPSLPCYGEDCLGEGDATSDFGSTSGSTSGSGSGSRSFPRTVRLGEG